VSWNVSIFEWSINKLYLCLKGTVELSDQIEVLQWLAEYLGYIDMNRLAIHGWSYGGYLSLMGLATYSNIFKVNYKLCIKFNNRYLFIIHQIVYKLIVLISVSYSWSPSNIMGDVWYWVYRKVHGFAPTQYCWIYEWLCLKLCQSFTRWVSFF